MHVIGLYLIVMCNKMKAETCQGLGDPRYLLSKNSKLYVVIYTMDLDVTQP